MPLIGRNVDLGELSALLGATKQSLRSANRIFGFIILVTLLTQEFSEQTLGQILVKKELSEYLPEWVANLLSATNSAQFLILTISLILASFKFWESYAHLQTTITFLRITDLHSWYQYPWIALERPLFWRITTYFNTVAIPAFAGLSMYFYTPEYKAPIGYAGFFMFTLYLLAGHVYFSRLMTLRRSLRIDRFRAHKDKTTLVDRLDGMMNRHKRNIGLVLKNYAFGHRK